MKQVLVISLISSQLLAGGIYFEEYATQRMGAAGAGNSVVARDASVAFHNPAGMTHLKGNNLSLGLGVIDISAEFSVDPSSPTTGTNGGDQGDTVAVPSLFYTHKYSDELSFGLALTSRMALILDPEDDWAGRYQVQTLDAMTVMLNPSVAYKVNEQLSIGFGLMIEYMQVELDMAIPSVGIPPNINNDGKINADIDDTSMGFNLGLMYDVSQSTRLGLTYWSEIEHHLDGDISVKAATAPIAGTEKLGTNFVMPQRLSLGLQQSLSNELTLLADVAWEDWSSMDANTLNNTISIPRNWDDTWHYAVGMNYQLDTKWLLQAGIAYDTDPTNAKDRRADMAVDEQTRYAIGAEYQYGEETSFGISYQYTDLGDAKIDNDPAAPGSLKGEYSSYALNTLLFTANWRF